MLQGGGKDEMKQKKCFFFGRLTSCLPCYIVKLKKNRTPGTVCRHPSTLNFSGEHAYNENNYSVLLRTPADPGYVSKQEILMWTPACKTSDPPHLSSHVLCD